MATKQPEEQLQYEDFLHLTVSLLKDFLALRGLKQSGRKAELIARAFGAYELNVPKKYTQEQIYKQIGEEYAKRLKTNNLKTERTRYLSKHGLTMLRNGRKLMMGSYLAIY